MRRHPAVLLLLALALVVAACGGDGGGGATTTVPGGSSTTAALSNELAEAVWYTDWDTGAVARWNIGSSSCDGVTPVGLSSDLIEVGLGWVWVTDCTGGQLVRLDVETGEVTGRLDLGACPSDIALAFDLVWVALPERGAIVAVDPETGAIVAEGTSDLDTPQYLAAGSLNVAGTSYYWRVDEVDINTGGGNDVWAFKLEDAASTYTQLPGQIQGLAVSVSGGNDAAVLVGPPADSTLDYADPNYPTSLYQVGMSGASQMGDPLMGFYNYLGAFDGHYVATSKATSMVVILNGGVNPVPMGAPPGPPVGGPPPPGGEDGGTGVWIGVRDSEQPKLYYFTLEEPPASLDPPDQDADMPAAHMGCQPAGTIVSLWNHEVLSAGDVSTQAALASQTDRSAFPMDPFPTQSILDTTPEGPRFSSCSVGYENGQRLLNGMEGTTDPGATVVLSIEVGTLLYTDLVTAVAGDDGQVVIPDFDLDDLTTPIPAGATITVVLTADGNDLGACRLDVET